jgi:hypothetical protein
MPNAFYFLQSVQTIFEAHPGSVNVFWSLLFSRSEASGPVRRKPAPYFMWSSSVCLPYTVNFHGEQRDSFIVLFTSRMANQPTKYEVTTAVTTEIIAFRNVTACSWRQESAFRSNLLSHLQERTKEVFSFRSARCQYLPTRKYGVTP